MAVSRPMRRGRRLWRWYLSELGRQVAVDLEPDADFDEARGHPGHDVSSSWATPVALALKGSRTPDQKVVEPCCRRNAPDSLLVCGGHGGPRPTRAVVTYSGQGRGCRPQ